jgi:hypothetical protein
VGAVAFLWSARGGSQGFKVSGFDDSNPDISAIQTLLEIDAALLSDLP